MIEGPYNKIFESIEKQSLDLTKLAVENGSDVNEKDPRYIVGAGNTPLHDAANNGLMEIASYLIESGANVNSCCDAGWTPLIRACNSNHTEMAKLLVKSGADVNAKNDEGYSAIMRTQGRNEELLSFLALHGADINA